MILAYVDNCETQRYPMKGCAPELNCVNVITNEWCCECIKNMISTIFLSILSFEDIGMSFESIRKE